jgi:hypothetical protein
VSSLNLASSIYSFFVLFIQFLSYYFHLTFVLFYQYSTSFFIPIFFLIAFPFHHSWPIGIPCGRLIVFSSFSPLFSLGGAAGLRGTFPGHLRPPFPPFLLSGFLFLFPIFSKEREIKNGE